ncbi:MAG: hypothetical protein IPP53_15430 [Bacteroidetes bacterium]|nr:hypothetical protein [Bacteroidota bacterium]
MKLTKRSIPLNWLYFYSIISFWPSGLPKAVVTCALGLISHGLYKS